MGCDRGGISTDPSVEGKVEDVCPGVPKGLTGPTFVGPNLINRTSDEQSSVVDFNVSSYFALGDGASPLWQISGAPYNAFILQDGTVTGVLQDDIAVDTDYFVTITYSTAAGVATSNTFTWTVLERTIPVPVAAAFSVANVANTLIVDNFQCSFQNADRYVIQRDDATPPAWNDGNSQPIANISAESDTLPAYATDYIYYIFPIDTTTTQVGLEQHNSCRAYDFNDPTPPSNFTITPGPDPSTQFTHTWSGQADAESGIDRVDLVDGYTLAVIESDASSGTVESGLDPETSYRRAVIVYDNVGNESTSNMDTETTEPGSPNLYSEVYGDWIASGGVWVAAGSSAGSYNTGGVAIANGADLYQDVTASLIAGHTYEMTVTVHSMTSGFLRFILGGSLYGDTISAPGVDIVRTIDWDGSTAYPFCGLTTLAGFNGSIQVSDGSGGTGIKLVDLGVTP